MRLVHVVVWVLADDDRLDAGQGCMSGPGEVSFVSRCPLERKEKEKEKNRGAGGSFFLMRYY